MNLTRLSYFVAVAEELHFGRAAERLHMSQPPLSQQIRLLEQELDAQLFDRTTRRVRLTDAGAFLYPEAVGLLAAAGRVDRLMDQHRHGHAGTLRVGFVDSAAYEVMPRLLSEYRRLWPKVGYELHTMSSDEQVQALTTGQIDLGIARATTRLTARRSDAGHARAITARSGSDPPHCKPASCEAKRSRKRTDHRVRPQRLTKSSRESWRKCLAPKASLTIRSSRRRSTRPSWDS